MPVSPTTGAERIEMLDALRGFALAGILLANLASFFGYSTYAPLEIVQLPWSDRGVLFAIDWLIEGKFYALFSMLFGMGFALQAQRMARGGADFARYWTRRMLTLLLIGLLHMFLVWHGDILTLYSLLGLWLLPFMNVSERTIGRWIVLLLITPVLMHVLVLLTREHPFWSSAAEWARSQAQAWGFAGRTHLQMRTSDNAWEVLLVNALTAAQRPMSYLQSGRYTEVLGMFLTGALLARTWLAKGCPERLFPFGGWRRLAALGLALSCGYAVMKGRLGTPYSVDWSGVLQGMLYHAGAILLALGIVGAFAWLWEQQSWRARLRCFAVPGRMPLSNYVAQNALAALIFFGLGFGLMRRLPFALIPLVAALIYLMLSWLSRQWLRRHAQGPLEGLWRKVSYSGSR